MFSRTPRPGEGQQSRGPEQLEGLAEFQLAAHEAGDRGRQSRGRAGQGGIATLDRFAELDEGRVRGGFELALEGVAHVVECRERYARAAPTVLGQHESTGESLVGRVGGNEPAELGDHGLVLVEGEAGVCPLDLGRSAECVEARGLDARHPSRCAPVKCRSSPAVEGVGESCRGGRRLPFKRSVSRPEGHFEPTRVDLVRTGGETIGGAPGLDAARQQAAQGGDLDLNGVLGRRWGLVAPQLIDQAVAGDEPVGLDQECHEKGARPGAAEPEGFAVQDHLERPQDPEVDGHADPFHCLMTCTA